MSKNKISPNQIIFPVPVKRSVGAKRMNGFSIIELVTAMGITLTILGVAVTSFTGALGIRETESSRTDALTSAQAAINIVSREISNSGYGLTNNGIVTGDSNAQQLHIRANTVNNDKTTSSPGEDITFFYDTASQSVVRYDANTGLTSGVINRVSTVRFQYYDYTGSTPTGPNNTPTSDTGRVKIILTVLMADVQGQPRNQTVRFSSDVTLRNSPYMLSQY